MSKPILFFALIHLLFINTTGAQVNITISNPSSIDRKGELVSVDWKSIQAAFPAIDTANFKVINKATKKELAWQLESQQTRRCSLAQLLPPSFFSFSLSV